MIDAVIDAVTVLRKELQETFGDRYAFRGPLLQAAMVLALTGFMIPAMDSSIWEPSAVMMLYVVFPSTLASIFAAEGFAGEKERHTLETLLATPVSDGAIFLGKTATGVLFVLCVSVVSLVTGLVVATARGLLSEPPTPVLFLGVFVGALGGALLTSAIGMAVSMRVPVARSAQQMSLMLTFIGAGVGAALLRALGGGLDWPVLLRGEAVVLVLAIVALTVAIRLFRRELFFERH